MRRACLLLVIYLYASSVGLLLLTGRAQASRGLSVNPGYVRMQVSGASPEHFAVSLKNDFTQQVTVGIAAYDVDTTSSNLVPLATAQSPAARSVRLDTTKLQILPGASANIKGFVVAQDLASGGHYAALVIKQIDSTDRAKVPIVQAVSVGLFIAKTEGLIQKLDLTSRLPGGIVLKKPTATQLKLKNNGNTDLTPYGAIEVKKGTETVAKSTINASSAVLFAGNTATYTETLNYIRSFMPDRYSVHLTYRYAGQVTPTHSVRTLWYVPWWLLLLLVTPLGVLCVARWRYLIGKFKRTVRN